MKIFIAGICGTFMGGIAQLAKASGHQVRGCDAKVYPPMSTLLQTQNIKVMQGYRPQHLAHDPPDTVLIGNVLARGNPLVEHVLNHEIPFQSGPEWLRTQVLAERKVIAVAGTHGKTTTASLLTWILDCDQHAPGYLIGGKPGNFAQSASLGSGQYFVIEADEYDTAFFDKRSKFVHYCPHIAVLNNLEFDHADIFDDLAQIMKQFHHLLRIIPSNGYVVVNADMPNLDKVIAMGCWSKLVRFSIEPSTQTTEAEWRARACREDCSSFEVLHHEQVVAQVNWSCIGRHNMQNALAALVAAELAGVRVAVASQYLSNYIATARRLQLLFQSDIVSVYDDFAHHPTAIAHTIAALRAKHPHSTLTVVVELRSNTMKMGYHGKQLVESLAQADHAIICDDGNTKLALPSAQQNSRQHKMIRLYEASKIISAIQRILSGNDVIITMSNGSFDELPQRIANHLAKSSAK